MPFSQCRLKVRWDRAQEIPVGHDSLYRLLPCGPPHGRVVCFCWLELPDGRPLDGYVGHESLEHALEFVLHNYGESLEPGVPPIDLARWEVEALWGLAVLRHQPALEALDLWMGAVEDSHEDEDRGEADEADRQAEIANRPDTDPSASVPDRSGTDLLLARPGPAGASQRPRGRYGLSGDPGRSLADLPE